MGAELSVDNETNTVTISSNSLTKDQLITKKNKLETDLAHLNKRKTEDQSQYDSMKEKGRIEGEAALLNSLEIINTKIKRKNEELVQTNESLKEFE
ncbi:hypothetical protein OHJ21_19135 [Virgibacillus sp. LDC1]|nr:hypothetical protein [Virgibacillus sp. LDC1]